MKQQLFDYICSILSNASSKTSSEIDKKKSSTNQLDCVVENGIDILRNYNTAYMTFSQYMHLCLYHSELGYYNTQFLNYQQAEIKHNINNFNNKNNINQANSVNSINNQSNQNADNTSNQNVDIKIINNPSNSNIDNLNAPFSLSYRDFVTCPNVSKSSIFADCILKQVREAICSMNQAIYDVYQTQSTTKNLQSIAEFGPGNAKMTFEILSQLEVSEFINYYIVECSILLIKQQKNYLREQLYQIGKASLFDKIVWCNELPIGFNGVIIMNEVLDAIAADLISWDIEYTYQTKYDIKQSNGYINNPACNNHPPNTYESANIDASNISVSNISIYNKCVGYNNETKTLYYKNIPIIKSTINNNETYATNQYLQNTNNHNIANKSYQTTNNINHQNINYASINDQSINHISDQNVKDEADQGTINQCYQSVTNKYYSYLYQLGLSIAENAKQQVINYICTNQNGLVDDSKYIYRYTSEVHNNMINFLQKLFAQIGHATVLFLDYGYSEREYYHHDKHQGTIRGFYQHNLIDNTGDFIQKEFCGNCDITSSVNFSLVAEIATNYNLKLLGYTTQAGFLINSGILNRQINATDIKVVKQLLSPNHMGEAFKVIGFYKPYDSFIKRFEAAKQDNYNTTNNVGFSHNQITINNTEDTIDSIFCIELSGFSNYGLNLTKSCYVNNG